MDEVENEEDKQLTAEEIATLKQGVFKALETDLDSAYRAIAVKDLNQITRALVNSVRDGKQAVDTE